MKQIQFLRSRWLNGLRTRGGILCILLVLAVGYPVKQGQSLELGLEPSQVFGLWTNINSAVLAYASYIGQDQNWVQQCETMEADTVSGKTPADVLGKVESFRSKLSALPTSAFQQVYGSNFAVEMMHAMQEDASVVTPRIVYLHSSSVLVDTVLAVNEVSGGEALIAPFFMEHGFSEKTPNDVYSQVDLAIRRVDQILINLR